jgi:outer membrane protein OmpA-like peptidoglycan-associated protein
LTLIAGIGVAHAEYQNVSPLVQSQQAACHTALQTGNAAGISANCNAGFVDSTGGIADPVRVPDYTLTLTATYHMDLGFMTVEPTATVSVEGAHAIGTAGDSRPGSDPKAYVGDELILDLGATFTPAAYPDFSLTAECKNCLSNDYPVSLLPPNQFLNNPGIWDVKLRYKFGNERSEPVASEAVYTPPPVQPPAPVAHSYMVFFDFNKSDLTEQATAIVDQAAKNAPSAKVTQLTVTGHTDTVGSDAYNMRLSRRRAESVAAELEKQGIPSSEIAIIAKGKRDLLVPTADGVKEPQNRRVQIVYDGAATS